MTGRNDFSNPGGIDRLSERQSPHWELIQFCRHIGVIKRPHQPLWWAARFRKSGGGYRQCVLGPMAHRGMLGATYAEALRAAENWFAMPENAAIASDPYPRGSKAGLDYCPWGDTFTIAHAMRDYIEWKRMAATQATFDALVSLINHHILPRIGTIPVEEFHGRCAKAFMLDVLETPPKRGNQCLGERRALSDLSEEELRTRKATVNTLVGILRLGLKLAWENGVTQNERAWRCIRRLPNRSRPRTTYLTRSECTDLLEACRPDLKDLVLGALYTGCRVSELDRLLVRDVAPNVFGLFVQASKSSSARFVFLPDEGMRFFLRLALGRDPEDHVFRHQDGRTWKGRYKHLFRKAVIEAKLPTTLVFHGLRHTYASQLVQTATPLIVVAQQLGHATADTVARTYGHMAPQIRAAQIRRNFAPLLATDRSGTPEVETRLELLAEQLDAIDWRSYGQIEPESSWPKANFGLGSDWTRSHLTRSA